MHVMKRKQSLLLAKMRQTVKAYRINTVRLHEAGRQEIKHGTKRATRFRAF
jgi:hypothetical protein